MKQFELFPLEKSHAGRRLVKRTRKPNCSDLILSVLSIEKNLSVHEVGIKIRERGFFHSDTAISARLRELAHAEKVLSFPAKGKAYKIWGLPAKNLNGCKTEETNTFGALR